MFFVQKRRFRRHAAGFSLIEMLVVVSIIGLLLGIGVVVGSRMTTEARREQTRHMMESLLSANDHYKAVRQGSSISHTGPVANLSSTEQFVTACLTIKECEDAMMVSLNSAQSESLERIFKSEGGDAVKSIYDRWGTELEYRQFNDTTGTGPANELGDTVANNLLPRSRDPFFASAGPDKEWNTDDDITTLQK